MITVSPASVAASQTTTLAFTYAAAAAVPSLFVTVTLAVPAGWPAPSSSSISVSCARSACHLTTSSTTIMVAINLDITSTFVLDDTTTAPGFATTSTFAASEQFAGEPPTTLPLPSPQVIVDCPDGQGTMTVSPAAVTAASIRTLTFTYQAGSCGMGTGGAITLTVPDGWTPPTTTPGARGLTIWTGGPLSIAAPMTIMVPIGPLGPGDTVSIDYEMAEAPVSPSGYTFDAAEQSGADGSLTSLAASPEVNVTPSIAGSSSPSQTTGHSFPPPPPSSAGSMTVSPAQVPASALAR